MRSVEESRFALTLGQKAIDIIARLTNDPSLKVVSHEIPTINYRLEITSNPDNNKLYKVTVSQENVTLSKCTEGWSDEKVNGLLENVKENYIAIYGVSKVSSLRKQVLDEMSVFVITDESGKRHLGVGVEFIDGNTTYAMLPKVVSHLETVRAGLFKLLAIKFTNNS